MPLTKFNTDFLEARRNQPTAIIAAAEMMALLEPNRTAEATKIVSGLEPAALTLVQVGARDSPCHVRVAQLAV